MSREEQPLQAAGRQRLGVIVILGLACVLVALGASHFLRTSLVHWRTVSPPVPRPKHNAPFILSSDAVVEKMVELAELTANSTVYDLGCGDGRIVITAALRSGCHGIGFDIDADRVREARENAARNGVEDRVTIQQQDIFRVDLSKADVAMMYLLPWMMDELIPQFERMKSGSRIISHEFWIEGVAPDKHILVQNADGYGSTGILVYTTPLKKNPAIKKDRPPALTPISSRAPVRSRVIPTVASQVIFGHDLDGWKNVFARLTF